MITQVKAILFTKEPFIYETPLTRDRSFDCKTAVLFLDSNNGKLIIENGIDKVKIDPEDNKMVLFENSKYATLVQQNYVRGIKLIINYT